MQDFVQEAVGRPWRWRQCQPSILFVGDGGHRETVAAVRSMAAMCNTSLAPNIDAAIAELTANDRPRGVDGVVLAQLIAGQFARSKVAILRRLAPTAPIILLLGSLSEGELRGGRALPGVVRVPWHAWHTSFLPGLRRLIDEGRCPRWALPEANTMACAVIDGDTEWLFTSMAAENLGTVAICSGHRASARWLADACRFAGYSAVVLASPQLDSATSEGAPSNTMVAGAAGIVWEPDSVNEIDPQAIGRLRRLAGGAPLIQLTGFPRAEDVARAHAAGASAVLAKPVSIECLIEAIRSV